MTTSRQNRYKRYLDSYKKNLSLNTRKEIERFFFAFILSWGIKTLLNEFPFFTQIFHIAKFDIGLQELIITQSKNTLELLGYEVYRKGVFMQIIGTYGVRLEYGCLAIRHLTLFIVFILSYFGKWYNKIWYIPLGALLISSINSLRIVILCIIQLKKPDLFHDVHDAIFPPIMYLATFILWIVWIKYFGKYKITKNQ